MPLNKENQTKPNLSMCQRDLFANYLYSTGQCTKNRSDEITAKIMKIIP